MPPAVIALAPLAASLAGKVISNVKGSKDKQSAYDAERAQWLAEGKPKAEAAAQRKLMQNNLRTSIAKSYGVDKLMPGFFNFSDKADAVYDPYAGTKRPGGFSWGGLATDALATGANALTSYKGVKAAEKAGVSPWGYGSSGGGYGTGSSSWRPPSLLPGRDTNIGSNKVQPDPSEAAFMAGASPPPTTAGAGGYGAGEYVPPDEEFPPA